MLEEYATFCYNQIGSYILNYLSYFQDLRPQLSKAGINVSLPEYVSMMFFTSIMLSMFTTVIIGTVWALTSGITGFIYSLTLSLVVGVGALIGFYLWPEIRIRQRSSKIQDKLPFATMYLSTLAGTGTSIVYLFKVLGQVDEYGEVAKEAEKITRDIETFNLDVSEALERAAERSPNREFKELMWGINHSMKSGSSLRVFLQERADRLMDAYRLKVQDFAEQLSLLVEMYIVLVIVGSIIFTSMSIVMSTFSSSMTPNMIVTVQVFSVFIGLPLISGMFVLLVSGLAPGGIR